ncbi:Chondroitin synthase [Anatilimnocola aggregata]|uniref:Chondroitin synthase n=1 Tax=Anatilimnocola aggregata TaxID=2528021 RepID=A0A517YNJ6_9BACT|nr:glycosyltransferase [Anatilimnocola aggregata]QDU31802.1 Chondroitin synthase [Anatilimnocola aggregata]
MSSPAVTVVVTTYQMPEHLRRVLAAVEMQTVASQMEVVVSDDGSTDETPEVVARFAARGSFPVKYTTLPHDGFQLSRTRNQGVRLATAPHIVFLDGDCLVEPDHVEQHLKSWRQNCVTNTYCVRLDEPTSQQVTVDAIRSKEYLKWVPKSELRKLTMMQWKAWFHRALGNSRKPALRGGNMGIAKADYLRVNGYDQRFKAWGKEDDDLGMRLRALGMKVDYILHRTRTYHLWHPPADGKQQKYKEGENYRYFTRKIRLTKCLAGLSDRSANQVTVRLNGTAADFADARRWVQAAEFAIVRDSSQRVDLEMALAREGRFTRHCDCRVLIAGDAAGQVNAANKGADVVLSADGSLGREHQVRLPLNEIASFYAALGFADPLAQVARREKWAA